MLFAEREPAVVQESMQGDALIASVTGYRKASGTENGPLLDAGMPMNPAPNARIFGFRRTVASMLTSTVATVAAIPMGCARNG
jgi:hypothetical protein